MAQANEYGRWLAMALMAFFGLTLLLPHLADRLTAPLVALGERLSNSASAGAAAGKPGGAGASFVLGIATGLLWAPCAGPILGLVLTGAALNGASVATTLLLLAYAGGAATSLAVALLIGGKVFAAMKRSLGAGEWIRRGLGLAMLCGTAVIALGLDTGLLSGISGPGTAKIEQSLLDKLSPPGPVGGGSAMMAQNAAMSGAGAMMAHGDAAAMSSSNVMSGSNVMASSNAMAGSNAMMAANAMMANDTGQNGAMMAMQGAAASGAALAPAGEGVLPPLDGAVKWLNSPPLTHEQLKGKVVLVDFWTYSCINCLRSLPYVKAWAKKYHEQGLVVIGVHAPEFAFERDPANVAKAVRELGIDYPVAVDNDYAIWRAFGNRYWPAHYFIDAKGQIRAHHFGEGEYAHSERIIRALLTEAGRKDVGDEVATAEAEAGGVGLASNGSDVASPETYLGAERAQNFASPGGARAGVAHRYMAPAQPALNRWGLEGGWKVDRENITLASAPGRIVYRFHARDVHLVMGADADADGKPVRFRVTLDGAAPGQDHGGDSAADGGGVVGAEKLYQLLRLKGPVTDHTFSIEFLDPGVRAYSFTFG